MRMLTTLTSRISLGKMVAVIHPLVQVCYLDRCVNVSAVPLVLIIGTSSSENGFRKIIFFVKMDTSIKAFLKMVIYRMESDGVT
jgi:hypothetical protein